MRASEQELLARALALAAEAHAGQTRKGSDVPYLGHPLSVAGLVLEFGGGSELAAVALLHDTVEDCPEVTPERLHAAFEVSITRRVLALTDLLEGDTPRRKGPWIDRKRSYLVSLADADPGTRLVAACDKLDNLRSLVRDLESHGVDVLERFTGSPAQTRWYYESVREVVDDAAPEGLRRELDQLLERLTRFVGRASPGG